MDESAGTSESDLLVEISASGDVILDVTFENSKSTLKAARKAASIRAPNQRCPPVPKARVRVGFRVELNVLKTQSKYFEKLLSDTRFKEGKAITASLAALSARNIKPAAADAKDLPKVNVVDDDEATHYAYREQVLGDVLRILHGKEAATTLVTMDFVTVLAVLADRFDCAAPISKFMSGKLKFKWPVTHRKPIAGEDARMSRNAENVLRQKILVSWLLNQPLKFQAATRELIMNGSCKWTSFPDQDDMEDDATWWYLQDGLEQELQFRRQSILNTIASVQRHFLALYTSRSRQCKLGYDSSTACDSYQLGEMLKFLTNRNLLFLVDFSSSSLDFVADTSLLQIDTILATLRQCPSYQIDRNHTNCGMRTRILPILDFIQALLSANSIPIARMSWKNNRQSAAWLPASDTSRADRQHHHHHDAAKSFQFTRAISHDQRLRFENALGAEKFAREVLTAPGWNWTADE